MSKNAKTKGHRRRNRRTNGPKLKPSTQAKCRQTRLKEHANSDNIHTKPGSKNRTNKAQTTRQIRPLIRAACYRYAAKKRENKHERAYQTKDKTAKVKYIDTPLNRQEKAR